MTSRIRNITFDCHDPELVGRFWAGVTGWGDDPDYPNSPGDPEWLIVHPDNPTGLLFIRVPEGKSVKNRLHLDVVPVDRTREEEVDRLLAAGATMVDDRRDPETFRGWAVLADPEGNEFCVERSDAERAADAAS